MKGPSLLELFLQSESELRAKLSNLLLPRDAEKFYEVVSGIFIENNRISEYKEELTDSEIAVFQSAIKIAEGGMGVFNNMIDATYLNSLSAPSQNEVMQSSAKNSFIINQAQGSILGVSALGALAGAIPCVGTILLAVLATSAGIWLNRTKAAIVSIPQSKRPSNEIRVNIDAIINATKELCHSIDGLMVIYRTNIDNLRSKYENKPEQTLSNTYGYLLKRLADLYRDRANNASIDDIYSDITKLYKTLENYSYEFVHYSESAHQFFDVEVLDEIDTPEEGDVAILEKGHCIVRGKYYKPQNN